LSNNNAVLEPVKLNDHHALGVVDIFAKKINRVLSKEFLENKDTEWVSILPKIIEQYGFVTNLKPGDKVRIDDTSLFKKGTESRWSDEVHAVQSAIGKSVTLTDGTMHRRSKILIVPHNTIIAPKTEKNVIKVDTKKHKDKSYFKREGISEANVVQGKRNR
jgi:hypothetical protein